ncbi:class F sortase [Streptomyces sp. NPDC057002]|uniref:class F sortase n=1 Tax=Streptomyces sp. NPDC057002 TaxID=3345992 RepID=UPI0036366382
MAFSLLLLGVCWDPGDEPGETVTALPTGSTEAAADALPGDSDNAPADASDTSAGTSALPSRSAPTPALPGNAASASASPGDPTPTPALPGRSTGPSGAPGPGTRTPQAPASRTAPAQGPGAQASEPPAAGHPAPGRRPAAGTPHPNRPPTSTRPRYPARTQTRPQPSTHPLPHSLPRSRATRLLIPYLRIDAPIMPLGLDRERRLTAPPEDNPKLVGWYQHGASPGEQGTAVAVGHLDTDRGPAVFAGLTELKRGREIKARRADGRIAVYTVDAIKSYEKDRFPNQEVYGARGRPELRLITCGGAYDRRKGYSGNVVVFAHLTAVR